MAAPLFSSVVETTGGICTAAATTDAVCLVASPFQLALQLFLVGVVRVVRLARVRRSAKWRARGERIVLGFVSGRRGGDLQPTMRHVREVNDLIQGQSNA